MKMLKYFAIAFIGLTVYFFMKPRRTVTVCGFDDGKITVATIKYGLFLEYIPQTGIAASDNTAIGAKKVKAPIDELYANRISKGLDATSTFNNVDYQLYITQVYPEVANGRFYIDLNFKDSVPGLLVDGTSIRLRITLSNPTEALLLPVGGFYKDTGGSWIFLVDRENHAVKRNIKLGRKMGSEYFEVLEGLKPGDEVITSTYQNFPEKDSIDLPGIQNL